MRKIESEGAFREAIAQHQPTVAVFKATWCKDCHFIEPFMPEVEAQYAGKLSFIEIDRDELADLCSEYHILGIPSFIGFQNGRELVRFVSKLRKSREEIEQFLNQVIEAAGSTAQ